MSQVCISSSVLDNLKPQSKPYFVRNSNLKGFAVKVNPAGSIKFVAEVKNRGRSRRKTLGEYPLLRICQFDSESNHPTYCARERYIRTHQQT